MALDGRAAAEQEEEQEEEEEEEEAVLEGGLMPGGEAGGRGDMAPGQEGKELGEDLRMNGQ